MGKERESREGRIYGGGVGGWEVRWCKWKIRQPRVSRCGGEEEERQCEAGGVGASK